MSVFTTQLRYICESLAGLQESTGYENVTQVINGARTKIFSFNYPIYDENYRAVLETKILKHFYTQEIGLETYGLWKLKLDTKMNEIMPYYNQLYESATHKFNPLYDVDISRQHTRKNNGKQILDGRVVSDSAQDNHVMVDGTSESSVTRADTDKYAETPQGGLTDLQNDRYLTNARMTNATDTSKGSSGETTTGNLTVNATTETNNNTTINNTEDYIETVTGKQGTQSYSSMIREYRESLINIDMMIIKELEELFMGIWEVNVAW